MLSIPRIGLLPPYHRRANLGRIPYPKLVSQRGQHPLEPLRVPGCFHAHADRLLQLSVKLLRLTVAVVESAFDEFASFRVHHRNLLEARMKITPYNQHTRLLSFRVLVSMPCQVYSASGRSRRCYLINYTHRAADSRFWARTHLRSIVKRAICSPRWT